MTSPRAQGLGDFVFFKLINEYFDNKIDQFGLRLMGRMMTWVSGIALTLARLKDGVRSLLRRAQLPGESASALDYWSVDDAVHAVPARSDEVRGG